MRAPRPSDYDRQAERLPLCTAQGMEHDARVSGAPQWLHAARGRLSKQRPARSPCMAYPGRGGSQRLSWKI